MTTSRSTSETFLEVTQRSIATVVELAARWHRSHASSSTRFSHSDQFQAGMRAAYVQAIGLLTDVEYREVERQLRAGEL